MHNAYNSSRDGPPRRIAHSQPEATDLGWRSKGRGDVARSTDLHAIKVPTIKGVVAHGPTRIPNAVGVLSIVPRMAAVRCVGSAFKQKPPPHTYCDYKVVNHMKREAKLKPKWHRKPLGSASVTRFFGVTLIMRQLLLY